MRPAALADLIRERAAGRKRFIVAIAGPPGSGKSTLAAELVSQLGKGARAVPMDGFHFDDRVLDVRNMRARKGAPETFDVAGFLNLMSRLQSGEDQIAIPIFDRSLEIARAGADIVALADHVLIVEGNYLLLNDLPWSQAAAFFDLTVFLDVATAELERRLVDRWLGYGKSPAEARAWVDQNDLPNIRRTLSSSRRADLTILSQAAAEHLFASRSL